MKREKNVLELLRASLVPCGQGDTVVLRSTLYMEQKPVTDALDILESKLISLKAGLLDLDAFDKLAILFLLNSAGLDWNKEEK